MDFRVVEELSVFPDTHTELLTQIFDCAADPLFRPHILNIETSLSRIFKVLEKSQNTLSSLHLLTLRNALYALPFFIAIDITESKERNGDSDLFSPSDLIGLFARWGKETKRLKRYSTSWPYNFSSIVNIKIFNAFSLSISFRMLTFTDSVVPSIAMKGLEFLLATRIKIRSTILLKIGGKRRGEKESMNFSPNLLRICFGGPW